MKLLVAVVDAGEARVAAEAGADTGREKPRRGVAGRTGARGDRGRARGPAAELPVSAAIGDMPTLPARPRSPPWARRAAARRS